MTEQAMNKISIRWLWVIVATLAVAPVFAQMRPAIWTTTSLGSAAAVALPQNAQTLGPASKPQIPEQDFLTLRQTDAAQRSTQITQRIFVR